MNTLDLPLCGREVHRCLVGDWVFWLEFLHPDVFVCIELSFRIGRDGRVIELERGDLLGLGQAVILAGRRVVESVALQDGTLQLRFDNGTFLQVPPHSLYEAWRVEGPGDFYAVCTPGGKVAVWGDLAEE